MVVRLRRSQINTAAAIAIKSPACTGVPLKRIGSSAAAGIRSLVRNVAPLPSWAR